MCARSGRTCRVGAVLEGSVARRDGQFHVIAQLIRASDGYHLWSHTYDASLAELPPVEERIGAGDARNPWLHRRPRSRPERAPLTHSPEAHDLYIRAAYQLNQRSVTSTRQAIALATQAAEKDPSFAQPYILMAAGESQLNTLLAQAPHTGSERAWADIAKALALDPGNSGAHAQKSPPGVHRSNGTGRRRTRVSAGPCQRLPRIRGEPLWLVPDDASPLRRGAPGVCSSPRSWTRYRLVRN